MNLGNQYSRHNYHLWPTFCGPDVTNRKETATGSSAAWFTFDGWRRQVERNVDGRTIKKGATKSKRRETKTQRRATGSPPLAGRYSSAVTESPISSAARFASFSRALVTFLFLVRVFVLFLLLLLLLLRFHLLAADHSAILFVRHSSFTSPVIFFAVVPRAHTGLRRKRTNETKKHDEKN